MTLHAGPASEADQALLHHVQPADWRNPEPAPRYNLVVVGGGTAGLVSAVGAASLGARVAIVERHRLGGDCLNYGCVPSKALIRSGRAVAGVTSAAAYGVRVPGAPEVDFDAVMHRMRVLRASLAPHDSVARLAGLGIDVFLGQARFVEPRVLDAAGARLRFTRAIIATGARAAVPPIPGLETVPVLTNETVFSLETCPPRLTVIGAGPIGCELAQVFARLGSEVTVVSDSARVLPRDDADAGAVVARALESDGVRLILGATIRLAGRDAQGLFIVADHEGRERTVHGDALLVAAGRRPNLDGLDLHAAGITAGPRGVVVDDFLRTTNRAVYAAGDITGLPAFTHAADAMARIAVQNALFFGRKRASALVIPSCTYTDPEVASVGLPESGAAGRPDISTFTVPMTAVDRAVLDGATGGFARVRTDRAGRVLGTTMVAPHAGEAIGEMALMMTAGIRLGTLASTVHPYPTVAEAWKRLGDEWNRTRLTPFVRRVLTGWLAWRR